MGGSTFEDETVLSLKENRAGSQEASYNYPDEQEELCRWQPSFLRYKWEFTEPKPDGNYGGWERGVGSGACGDTSRRRNPRRLGV